MSVRVGSGVQHPRAGAEHKPTDALPVDVLERYGTTRRNAGSQYDAKYVPFVDI